MIIFDLDGTLANCDHRRHFVDPNYNNEYEYSNFGKDPITRETICDAKPRWHRKDNWDIKWKPDWKAFYEACDEDEPIIPVWRMFVDRLDVGLMENVQIWSGRCESVRDKTEAWLMSNLSPIGECELPVLKMRPIGDSTPDDQLKERWLDELTLYTNPISGSIRQGHHNVEFVFDDRPKVVRMWRRRGIFVFNCCQHDEEF